MEAQQRWHRAEELGFEHAWTYDHLTWRTFRDQPWYSSIPTLAAAALATKRLRIGTLVASPNFRHPLPFAKDLITLDDISGGRAMAGIGAGGRGWDATMLGHAAWSHKERSERFAEFVELADLLLRHPVVTWEGKFYAVKEARTYPGCVQDPRLPFVIAARTQASIRVAVQHGDVWVTTGDPTEGRLSPEDGARVVAKQIRTVDDACNEIGRDPTSLRKMVLSGLELDPQLNSIEAFRDAIGRYHEIGVTDFVVHWPRDTDPFALTMADFERIFSA